MKSLLYKLWRIPLRHALWLALPLQILMFWTVQRGWEQYQRNLSLPGAADRAPGFDLDQLRYFAKKEFERSLSRTMMPEFRDDGLETISLDIDRRHLGSLTSDLPRSGKSQYYPAMIEVDGKSQRIKTRFMGDNHWHWLYPQKSWKVKTRSGNPIRNRRLFNLKNPPTITAVEDQIANALSVELGLLAPDIEPVKFFVNGAYAGLYLWWDIADESLLRRFRRMPGSIYSGDGAPSGDDGVAMMYGRERFWKKDSARNAEQKADRSDIRALIAAINEADAAGFRAYSDDHLNLLQFARFIALDRLLGGQHHDRAHNHKLYVDPYKGRVEPIQWDFAFWRLNQRRDGLDQALHLLLEKIRQHPAYELAIQVQLWQLMQRVTPAWLDGRIDSTSARMRSALMADGFRDVRAGKESSKLRLARQHCASFSMEDHDRNLVNLKDGYRRRFDWLNKRLASSRLATATARGPRDELVVSVASGGLVGQEIVEVEVQSSGDRVEMIEDRNRNGRYDAGERIVASAPVASGVARLKPDSAVFPGLKKAPLSGGYRHLYGTFQLVPAVLHYSYLLHAPAGRVETATIKARNAITGAAIDVEQVGALADAKWTSDLSTWTCHPWSLPAPPEPRTVTIGPGEVALDSNMLLGAEVSVRILPGTTLRLAPGVSVEMRGQVLAEGTEEQPIRVEPAVEGEPWGVFALHGEGTAGSRFAYCEWRDGSTAKIRSILRTGMVSIIETSDLRMDHCFVGANHVGDDALHWGYLTDAVIRDSKLHGARSDAFDIDISREVRIVRCEFRNSGNDSVDLMTSAASIEDCQFYDAGDKGVSVGEDSEMRMLRCVLERCLIGVEIKDSSVARIDAESRMRDCATGVNLYRKNPRYSEGGTLVAEKLAVIGSANPVTKDKRSKVQLGELVTEELQ